MAEEQSHSQATNVATKSMTNTKLAVATAFLGLAAVAAAAALGTNTRPCKSTSEIVATGGVAVACLGDTIVYPWDSTPTTSVFFVRHSKDVLMLGSLNAAGTAMEYTRISKGETQKIVREYPTVIHVLTVMYRGMDSTGHAVIRSKQDTYYPSVDPVVGAPVISALSNQGAGVLEKNSVIMKFGVTAKENVDAKISRLTFAIDVTPIATSTSPNMMLCTTLAPSGNGWLYASNFVTSTPNTKLIEADSGVSFSAHVAFRMEDGTFCGKGGRAKYITFDMGSASVPTIPGGTTQTFALVMDSTSLSTQSGTFSLTPRIISENEMPKTSNIFNQAQIFGYGTLLAVNGDTLTLPVIGGTKIFQLD